jgi:hypothetical protein
MSTSTPAGLSPRRVDESHREIMQRVANEQLDKLRGAGQAQLSDLSFNLAIEVACAVIGLTESRAGLQHRLERFFPEEFGEPGFSSLTGLYWVWRQATNWSGIYFNDVRPAVRARRARRPDLAPARRGLHIRGNPRSSCTNFCGWNPVVGHLTRRTAAPVGLLQDAGLIRADVPARQLVWELFAPLQIPRVLHLTAEAADADIAAAGRLIDDHVELFLTCVTERRP